MSVEDPWLPFKQIMEAPWETARQWKEETGGKVIGHLLPDVPEELLHAAGALPVAVEGAGVHASHAPAHIPGYTCNHAMGAVEMGLRGDLDVLDGMIIPYVCDTTRNLSHTWSILFPEMPAELVRLPKRLDYPGIREYLRNEFSRLLESAGRITGRNPDNEEISQSVKLYNRCRARLRDAYSKQREAPSIWTSERVQLLIGSALRAPREEHVKWMDALPWDEESEGRAEDRIPLYVRGKVWDPPGILELMDRLGFLVVRDEIVTGYRSIARDAPLNGDPMGALVERHLSSIPYPGYHMEPRSLVKGFMDRVNESRARGVLFLNPKFCETAAFDTPDFQKALEDASIPSLILETSARGVSAGQIHVRLEAFREMIAGDLP